MIRIVVFGGTGDVYLISALVEAFKKRHGRNDVELIIKNGHSYIAELFGVKYVTDDALISKAETDIALQRDYDNVIAEDRLFFAHPSFLRTNMRVDHLTTRSDVSQADMYKIILRIPPDVQLALPTIPAKPQIHGKVVVISDARSWPNLQPTFWPALATALSYAGWNVQVNNPRWSLRELFAHCMSAEWVIGPQCGVMSILTTGRFPCRKTFATPDIDGNAAFIFSTHTFPYGYVTKFSNEDYDVEEFKIAANTHGDLIEAIVNGSNSLRLWPHNPNPVTTVNVSLSPGDFLDRLAVLTVKRNRFPVEKRAAIERQYQRYVESRLRLKASMEIDELFDKLVNLHDEIFDLLERMVVSAIGEDSITIEDHIQAVRSNKIRIELKQAIDAACHAPYSETKSYYGEVQPKPV